jgi:hypothetical protein
MVETLWDHKPDPPSPLLVRVFAEVRRLIRRAPYIRSLLGEEGAEQEGFDLQVARLTALDPVLGENLRQAPSLLMASLANVQGLEIRDLLLALHDLRAEAAPTLLPLLARPGWPHKDLAVEVLAWSADPQVGWFLREWVWRCVPVVRRARRRRRTNPPSRPSLAPEMPYRSILRVLRHHPSLETESLLLLAAGDWDPLFRAAAFNSLGWWEPFRRADVLDCLQEGRRDAGIEVRQAARAALARLGERQALLWFRQALTSEDSHQIHEAIHAVAQEGLTLLWPDLDRLADAPDPDIALHAREAVGRLFEEMEPRQA